MRFRITVPSPLGTLTVVADHQAVVGVRFPGEAEVSAEPGDRLPVLVAAREQLAEYFAGLRTAFDLPLHPHGTEFQKAVWSALRDIPFGETRSYGAVARAIGRPAAIRAVGAANGRNPIAIAVPCHRVVGADGSLTGYGGGLAAKEWLLAHEAAVRARQTPPG